jgi:hypothetical protein
MKRPLSLTSWLCRSKQTHLMSGRPIDSDNSHHFCETENLTASSMLFYSMLSNTSCSSQVDCEVRICVIWLVIRAI